MSLQIGCYFGFCGLSPGMNRMTDSEVLSIVLSSKVNLCCVRSRCPHPPHYSFIQNIHCSITMVTRVWDTGLMAAGCYSVSRTYLENRDELAATERGLRFNRNHGGGFSKKKMLTFPIHEVN